MKSPFKDLWHKTGAALKAVKQAFTPKREKKGAFLRATAEGVANGLLLAGGLLACLSLYAPISLVPCLLFGGIFLAAGAGLRLAARKIEVADGKPTVEAPKPVAADTTAPALQPPSPAPGFNRSAPAPETATTQPAAATTPAPAGAKP